MTMETHITLPVRIIKTTLLNRKDKVLLCTHNAHNYLFFSNILDYQPETIIKKHHLRNPPMVHSSEKINIQETYPP